MPTSTKVLSSKYVLCALVLATAGMTISACSDNTVPEIPDTGVPPSDSGPRDAGVDSAVDTGPRPDTGPLPDTGATPDTGVVADTGIDAASDIDADVDANTVGTDAGTDAFVATSDTGVDAFVPPVDSGMDAFVVMVDAGSDAGSDGGSDAGRDAFVAMTDAYTPGCGNGVLDMGEQCDDGDLFNLDGCDSGCRYEPVARVTNIAISRNMAPAMCTHRGNRFGMAINGLAVGTLNTSLNNGINAGTTNILIPAVGLDDLTGVADTAFSLGIVGGVCETGAGACPRTGNPLDSWYRVDHAGLDAMGHSTSPIMAAVAARAITTSGSPSVTFPFTLGASSLLLGMNNVHIIAQFGNTTSRPAAPPTSLRAGTVVWETINGTGSTQGICGDITVASLAQIPVPTDLAVGGATACGACGGAGARTYTSCGTGPVGPGCNSLLDVFVGGCQVMNIICVAAIAPTQPDVAGGAAVRTLSLGAGNKVMASQLTGNTDAYSSYLNFSANRVHITSESCMVSGDCQTGQTCTANVCM